MEIRIATEAETDAAAGRLLAALGERRHVALLGEMGAGKTTLTAAVGRLLGVADEVTSPTFSIINEYRDRDDEPVYHFDFYRIDTPEEALDLGLDEYFDSGALCIMEWPLKVAEFLPDDIVPVTIRVEADGSRTIILDEEAEASLDLTEQLI
ncbi:MAG: tRNA (adenosine(37)-N6)-threonylcarbamoyltransferase complex ATPase subunit type 1 TsaE [Muribaculaceae bacterium]|nr:tRNA (adenosine(37)-N6)-threonylcarbamoyltransferase complex ATPase subunit type 1 TsaE [Muribaculaceae bacterium]